MQLPEPYFFTSERTVGLVDRSFMALSEGPIADAIYGFHTLWIAEVPFIPTYSSDEQRDFDATAANRLEQVLGRLVRFLYDLAQSRDHLATFELRFLARPQAGRPTSVGIAFIGKSFHEDCQTSRSLALEQWNKFSAIFPREAPFSYPLVPIREYDQSIKGQSFLQWYEPIPFARLRQSASIIELRKYEDWPTVRDIGGALHARDYIAHPFVAALDYSALARLFETLAGQREICLVAITLRPQRLTDQEIVTLHDLLSWYHRVARGEATLNNPLVDVLREFNSDIFQAYLGTRAALGTKVYESFVREHRSLFTVRLQVIGDPIAPNDVIEALGSEVMANAGNAYPSRWVRVEASSAQEMRWAKYNLQWLEFARWGTSPLIRSAPTMMRLRQLATVAEVVGAFRLPVAPISGSIAGIEVRDEPFSLPITWNNRANGLNLGMLNDRGLKTEIPLCVPLEVSKNITYLFGESGLARNMALYRFLEQLGTHRIPWLLIRDAGQEQLLLPAETIQHVSLDIRSSSSTLGIHPFLPPSGIALPAFIDAFLRVITAVYGIDVAAMGILRRLLQEAYEQEGWTVQGSAIDLTKLTQHLDQAVQRLEVPSDLVRAIRKQCILPLQDLAATVGTLFSTSANGESTTWITPMVIDIGWLGSDTTRAVVRGALWSWFALALSLRDAPQALRGLIALEDARTIFGGSSGNTNSSQSMSTLTQSFAQTGVGTLLIEDQPHLFAAGITQATGLTIVTRNGNEVAQDRAAALIGASHRARARMRLLHDDEALVSLSGQPLLLISL